MPLAVRVLFGGPGRFVVLVTIHGRDPVAGGAARTYEVLYNSVLIGSAVLCFARVAFGRSERLAWTVMGVALTLWAAGNLYWQLALSDLAEAPYPSVADALWLGFLPVCYLGVVLLARERMPQLDSRLWLDGIIAALTTGAISAAVVFGAVQASTGGDTAAVATNLAYPLGDMILLGSVIGAMAAGRGRLDRSWLCFGAGIAVFAVADSIYLLQIAKGTYVVGTLLDIGWLVGTLLVGLAAWQPAVRKRPPATSCPASSRRSGSRWPASRCSSTTTSSASTCSRSRLPAPRSSRRSSGSRSRTARAAPISSARACRRARTPSPGSATASPSSVRSTTRWPSRRRTCF